MKDIDTLTADYERATADEQKALDEQATLKVEIAKLEYEADVLDAKCLLGIDEIVKAPPEGKNSDERKARHLLNLDRHPVASIMRHKIGEAKESLIKGEVTIAEAQRRSRLALQLLNLVKVGA